MEIVPGVIKHSDESLCVVYTHQDNLIVDIQDLALMEQSLI